MHNIWEFLLQTLSVSLVAALILVVKWMLADKLSPRWQYGVWLVLAARLLLPADPRRVLLLPIPLWVETWKGMAESALQSAYSAVYTPIAPKLPLPILSASPVSLTDWLFVLYATGAVLTLVWYLTSYLRLRLLLRRGAPPSQEIESAISRVCRAYGLPSCPVAAVRGLPSAFICGPFRPILAVPAETVPDDKILLHELLHLKYRDALQSVLWCALRALHWCNPFLQYVFNRVGNDMESLCDQRVLERLEGEARREYGVILLDMANRRYARAPGTSSLSNGGRNISRRIAAIVRFKKYPQGMALVSVCIAVVLSGASLYGSAASYTTADFTPHAPQDLSQAMAMARLSRCTTIAGALDTYAKGLIQANGIYIATASSLDRHETLEAEMHGPKDGAPMTYSYYLDPGDWLHPGKMLDGYGYSICNLARQPDGSCTGLLALYTDGLWDKETRTYLSDEHGNTPDEGTILIPVTVREEDGWVVEESGPRQTRFGSVHTSELGLPLRTLTASGRTGRVTVENVTVCRVDNTVASPGWNPFGFTSFDNTPKLDAEFESITCWDYITYHGDHDAFPNGPVGRIMLQAMTLDDPADTVTFPLEDVRVDPNSTNVSGSSTSGAAWVAETVGAGWDGTLFSGSGGSMEISDSEIPPLPAAYQAAIFWNGELVDEFLLEEGAA